MSSSSLLSSTLSSSHRQLSFVSQNNQGLIHLKNGNIIGARKCFVNALRGAQMGLMKNADDNSANTPNDNDNATSLTAASTTPQAPTIPAADTVSRSPPNNIPANKNNANINNNVVHHHATSNDERGRGEQQNILGDAIPSDSTISTSDSSTTSISSFREELLSRLQVLPTTSHLKDQAISLFLNMNHNNHHHHHHSSSQQQQQQEQQEEQSPPSSLLSLLGSANMALIYSVIIYNMGLVYHIRGRQCQNNNQAILLLRKAMDLYEKAHSIVLVKLVAPVIRIMTFEGADNDEQLYYSSTRGSITTTTTTTTARGGSSSSSSNMLMMGTTMGSSRSRRSSSRSRNPIVDLLRLSLLKQMADIQKSFSNVQAARYLGEEISAFIMSVGEFIYRNSRVTELMQIQVRCFLMYAISLKQQQQGLLLVGAPAA